MSTLEDMVKNTLKGKNEKATKLTPVGTEVTREEVQEVSPLEHLPGNTEPFLWDMPAEQIHNSVAAIRTFLKHVREEVATIETGLDGIDAYLGRLDVSAVAVDTVKAAEKVADDRAFAVEFAAMQEKAKAATFASLAETEPPLTTLDAEEELPEVHVTNVDGWVCPEHGDEHLTKLKQRKGKDYYACTKCGDYQK